MPVFGKIPNIVIVFETLHTSIAEDVNKALAEMDETWKETKDTLNNLKIATKDALRVRGDSARKIEEAEIWKQVSRDSVKKYRGFLLLPSRPKLENTET